MTDDARITEVVALWMIREGYATGHGDTLSDLLGELVHQVHANALLEAHNAAQASIESALRDAFPHFQDDAPITPEAIKSIGREYLEMVMGWEPQKTEIEFADDDGNIRKIVYEPGEYEAGTYPGWVLDDSASLPSAQPAHAQAPLDPQRLIDWTYLYATEGSGWPDYATIVTPLIKLAQRSPTQDDADRLKIGATLKGLLSLPSVQRGTGA